MHVTPPPGPAGRFHCKNTTRVLLAQVRFSSLARRRPNRQQPLLPVFTAASPRLPLRRCQTLPDDPFSARRRLARRLLCDERARSRNTPESRRFKPLRAERVSRGWSKTRCSSLTRAAVQPLNAPSPPSPFNPAPALNAL